MLPAAAYVTATISGVLGMAGGIALVAVMTAVLPAAHVVPVHGVVQLASNFTRTCVFLPHVKWKVFLYYAPTVAIGMAGAAWVWTGADPGWFKPGIGAFILAFLVWRRKAPKLRNLPYWTYVPVGLATGFLAVFVGATGPFIAPFFLRDDFEKERVIATKAVCQAWGHLLKIPTFLFLGFAYREHLPLIGVLLACVVLGTFTGKWALGRLKESSFILLYETVLAGIAVFLLVRGGA